AAVRIRRGRVLREQIDRQTADTQLDRSEQNPQEPQQAERHGRQRQHQRNHVLAAAPPLQLDPRGFFPFWVAGAGELSSGLVHLPPSPFSRRSSMSLDSESTMNVIRNRIKPSSISADVCKPGLASANSLASAEVMLLPGENSETLSSRLVLPITNVTAIVSPSARPRPSITPPITPVRVNGNTIFHITSQVVQPMPYADSFSRTGVTSNTSRITAAMYGMIMIAKITPAQRMPMPIGGPLNNAPTIGMPLRSVPSGFSNHVAKIGANTSRPHMP